MAEHLTFHFIQLCLWKSTFLEDRFILKITQKDVLLCHPVIQPWFSGKISCSLPWSSQEGMEGYDTVGLIGSLSHYLQGFTTIPGGCWGFLPSTAWKLWNPILSIHRPSGFKRYTVGAAGSVEISGAGRLCGHCWAPRPDARVTKGFPAKIVDNFLCRFWMYQAKLWRSEFFCCHSFGFKTQLLNLALFLSTVHKYLVIFQLILYPPKKVGEHHVLQATKSHRNPSLAPFVHPGSCRRHLNGCHSYVSQPWWLGFHFSTSDRENQSLRIMHTQFLLPFLENLNQIPPPKKIHSISPQSYCN